MRVPAIGFVLINILLVSSGWASDRASARIGLTIPKLVQITELRDIQLDQWSGSGDLQSEQTLCVWSSTGGYSLIGESDNAEAGQFRLTGPDAQTAHYQVYWDDGTGFREVRSGEALTNLAAARERECAGEEAVRPSLRVRVDDQSLANVAPGEYGDQLQLTVVAE